MNRCKACGAAIAKDHEVYVNNDPYHDTHAPVANHIQAFDTWANPHLQEGKMLHDVMAAYLQLYPARTVPLIVQLKQHHDRHKTCDPHGPLQGTEEASGGSQGEEQR